MKVYILFDDEEIMGIFSLEPTAQRVKNQVIFLNDKYMDEEGETKPGWKEEMDKLQLKTPNDDIPTGEMMSIEEHEVLE